MNITDSEIMGGVGFGYDQYSPSNMLDGEEEFAFSEVLGGPRIQRKRSTTPVGKLSRCMQERGIAPSFTRRRCAKPRKICQVEPKPVVRRTYHTCKEHMTSAPQGSAPQAPEKEQSILPNLGITTDDMLIILFIFIIVLVIMQMYNTSQICKKIRKMMKTMKRDV